MATALKNINFASFGLTGSLKSGSTTDVNWQFGSNDTICFGSTSVIYSYCGYMFFNGYANCACYADCACYAYCAEYALCAGCANSSCYSYCANCADYASCAFSACYTYGVWYNSCGYYLCFSTKSSVPECAIIPYIISY